MDVHNVRLIWAPYPSATFYLQFGIHEDTIEVFVPGSGILRKSKKSSGRSRITVAMISRAEAALTHSREGFSLHENCVSVDMENFEICVVRTWSQKKTSVAWTPLTFSIRDRETHPRAKNHTQRILFSCFSHFREQLAHSNAQLATTSRPNENNL